MLLNWFTLEVFGNNLNHIETKSIFIFLNWICFLSHAIAWRYIIRRLLVHYKAENLLSWLQNRH